MNRQQLTELIENALTVAKKVARGGKRVEAELLKDGDAGHFVRVLRAKSAGATKHQGGHFSEIPRKSPLPADDVDAQYYEKMRAKHGGRENDLRDLQQSAGDKVNKHTMQHMAALSAAMFGGSLAVATTDIARGLARQRKLTKIKAGIKAFKHYGKRAGVGAAGVGLGYVAHKLHKRHVKESHYGEDLRRAADQFSGKTPGMAQRVNQLVRNHHIIGFAPAAVVAGLTIHATRQNLRERKKWNQSIKEDVKDMWREGKPIVRDMAHRGVKATGRYLKNMPRSKKALAAGAVGGGLMLLRRRSKRNKK